MHTATSFVLTLLVLGYAVVSGLVGRWYVAPPALIFFVGLGMLFGPPFGFNLLQAGPGTEGFTILAQLALTVILFNQPPSWIRARCSGVATSHSGCW